MERFRKMIPYGSQVISEDDIDSVISVLKSDFLTQGPKVPLFEKAVSEKVGANHAVALNSATSALHISCLSLGLGSGDWLWTTPISFVASANCALYCGANVDFVDIDSLTFNLSALALEEKLVIAEREGRLPKIVIPVHLCGQSCDMEAISSLAQRFGFKIIEDASHAIGGKYQDRYVGDCRYSDITVFSFHPVKIVTTAEGGMALTNDPGLAEKMSLYRSHGITREPHLMTHNPDGPWYYQQIELGYNYRMTELQAALGISQMTRLDNFVARRNELSNRYDHALKDLPLTLPKQNNECYSSRHLYVIRLHLDLLDITHKGVFNKLREGGVGVNLHYIPIHTQPFYTKMGFVSGSFPEAEKYYQEAISIPVYSGMTNEQQDECINKITSVVLS